MNRFTNILKGALALAITFSCLGASAAVNYVADPDPADMVSELSSVTLTFPDASTVDKGSKSNDVTVTSENFNRGCTLEYGDNDNQMVVSFTKISEEGTYTLNIPADAIIADGNSLEAFTITYNVGEEVVKNGTLIPAPGEVKWLTEVVFYDPDVNATLSAPSYSEVKPTLTTPSGEISELTPIYDYQIGNGKYRFRLRKLAVEPGTYTINFPADYMYYSGPDYTNVYIPAYQFTYEVIGGTLTQVISDPSVTNPTNNFNHLTLEFPGYETIAIKEMSYAEKNIPVYMTGKESQVCQISLESSSYSFTIEGNKMSYTNAYQDYIDPGHYYMTFPQGGILLGEAQEPCTPFMVEFDVVAPAPVVIDVTPASDSTVSMLYSATIAFPDIEMVEFGRNPSVALYKVNTENGEEKLVSMGGAFNQSAFERLSDNSFKVLFDAIATVDGKYRITLRTNSFVYEGGFNQEYSVDVNFVAPPIAPVFSLTPDNAEALDKIQSFTITFPDQSVVKLNERLANKTVVLYEGEELVRNEWGGITNKQIASTAMFTAVEGATNSFSFSLGSPALDKGKYLLSIPAGIFLIGEDPYNFNAAAQVIYECTGEGLDKIELTPNVPVKELEEMAVKFIDQTSISFQSEYTGFSLYKYLEGQEWGEYKEYISGENKWIEGNTLYLKLQTPITEEGRYYTDITAYSLFMSDGTTVSTPQRIYFTVDPNAENPAAVETVVSDGEEGRIFTITGLEVKDMSAPGIYVKNGRKIIVR